MIGDKAVFRTQPMEAPMNTSKLASTSSWLTSGARADRRTDGELLFAVLVVRQQQTHHIDACDQEDGYDGTEDEADGGTRRACQVLPQIHQRRAIEGAGASVRPTDK
jgi:hypothetical protein